MNEARFRTWTVGLAVLVIGTLGAFIVGRLAANFFLLPATLTRESRSDVPDLVGRELEDAREEVEDAGAALDVLGLVYSAEADSGAVVFQYPPQGLPLEKGKPVEVIVAAGQGERRMPDLVELPEASALAMLETAGIPVAGVRGAVHEGFEKGTVISTDPPAGAPLGAQDSVVVVVSRGDAIVEVPSLIGKSPEEAAAMLQGAHLRVGETTFAEPAGGGGAVVVLGQDPPAGGLARTGAAVNLHLGQGAEDEAAE